MFSGYRSSKALWAVVRTFRDWSLRGKGVVADRKVPADRENDAVAVGNWQLRKTKRKPNATLLVQPRFADAFVVDQFLVVEEQVNLALVRAVVYRGQDHP